MLFNSMTALAEEVTPTATTAAGGEFISMIIMLVVMFGVMYFLMIRPQKKKEKAAADADGYQVFKMPWSINFSTGFNITEDTSKPINRKNMRYPYKFSLNSLNINGNVKLTNKWAVSFNSGYDFNAKEITQTAFNITRDLHCFSMTAAISPFGRWKYYNFTIRANASILQDLKWEQRSQTQSNIQWY